MALGVLFACTPLESFMTLCELEAFSFLLLSVNAFVMRDCFMIHAKTVWETDPLTACQKLTSHVRVSSWRQAFSSRTLSCNIKYFYMKIIKSYWQVRWYISAQAFWDNCISVLEF